MRITCGTDFSERSQRAADVAALLAERSGGRLALVHGLDSRGAMIGAAHVLKTLESNARERLESEAQRLRSLGATVETALPEGWADEALLAEAQRTDADLVVLSALSERDTNTRAVGKIAERTLARTTVPMLVVRDAAPLLSWLTGDRPLSIMAAFDFGPHSAAALAFAARFAKIGNCRITIAHIEDPRKEAARLGLGGDANAAAQLIHDKLADRAAELEPGLPAEIVLAAPGDGNAATRLRHLAEMVSADLIITGTQQRSALARLFAGSVSLQLLREASANVMIVPGKLEATTGASATATSVRGVRRMVVATDLSEHCNLVLAHAFAMAPAGSVVTVVHVIHPHQLTGGRFGRPHAADFEAEHMAERQRREKLLAELLPEADGEAQRSIRIEIIESEHPARALVEFAQHIDADLLAIGTLGESGLTAALTGSVAQQVLRQWKRPMLLVPPRD